MNVKFSLVIALVLSAFSSSAVAQTNPDPNNFSAITEVLNPTPEASSLGKYGGVPINLSSGALDLSIPLYNFSSTNIEVPITLMYNSNCIRVNDVAPSVGMSWALNAGGVITRTVRDMADDFKQRISPPATYPTQDSLFINFMLGLTASSKGNNSFDGQPDLFSFNFGNENGKFILDSSLHNPILLTYSGLKIESQLTLNDAALDTTWHFRITTPDGTQYYFGGKAVEWNRSLEVTEDGVTRNALPSSFTAFYLNEIIHPNHDTVWISYMGNYANYIDNISETMYGLTVTSETGQCLSLCQPYIPHPSTPWSQAYNTCYSSGLLVQQISSSSGAKVIFNYIPRKDITQNLLSSIQVFQPGQTAPFKVFHLNYQYAIASGDLNVYQTDSSFRYRPFLASVVESSPDSSLTKTYSFNYNDIGALPPRLSYAQDDYGFFNGQTSNETLIPPPTTAWWLQYMPYATADRSIDTNDCLKGLLTKVIYPTGGSDSIVYEPNSVYGQVAVENPPATVTATATGAARYGTPVDDTVVLQFAQTITLNASCFYTQNPPDNPDSLHDVAALTLTGIAGTDSGVFLLQTTIAPGSTYNSIGTLTLQAGTYVMDLRASGLQVASEASLTYVPGALTYQYQNTVVGGNRVKRLITQDPVSGVQNIKRYYYGKLNSLQNSSAILMYSPNYERPARFFIPCQTCAIEASNGTFLDPFDYRVQEYDYPCEYSNTQINLDAYGSSPVSYAAVTESFGENFENGGIEHDFTNTPDLPGDPLMGNYILGSPLTSYSFVNGRETAQYVVKKGADGNYIPVKTVYDHFRQDTRVDTTVNSYDGNVNYMPMVYSNPPDPSELAAFNLTTYQYLQQWMYPDTVRTLTYDNSGSNYVTDTVITQYNNPKHALPTTKIQSASNGKTRTVNYYYPYDVTLTGNPEAARQSLIANYMIDPVLQTVELRGGDTTVVEHADYNVFPNGLTLPQTHSLRTGNNSLEPRVQFYNYNNSGKLLEESKVSDQHISYIWDYNSMYPVAKAVNASNQDIAYTSFEADGSGNWSIGSGSVDTTQGITGRNSYHLTGSISKSGLNPSTTYIVSYWSQNGAYNIPGTMTGYPVQGKTIAFFNPSWTLYVHKVTGQSTITLTGSGHIDELRLYPSTSQMTTYTYSPLVGMTSQADAGNRVTYYEYDGLARLKRIRDQDYNILRSYDYQYQTAAGCGSGCYILSMQTFAGTGTLSYPVGVFNVSGKLLGNATNAANYVSVWNSDTADNRVGTLSAGADPMHFNITINSGQTPPTSVTGCRYYQWDLPWNVLDGIMLNTGAYVDFGDGTGMKIPKTPTDTTGFAPNTTFPYAYTVHTYADTSMKTITIYHNDGNEIIGLDNANSPATSLNKVRHLRGYFPQHTAWGKFSSMWQASALTFDSIYNWNSISSLATFQLATGDGGISQCRNVSFPQDFMKDNRGLQTLYTSYGGYNTSGVMDTTFKLTRLKSDWNTYFTQLQSLQISDDHWNREDLSALTQLNNFRIAAGNHDGYGSFTPIPAAASDNMLNQIAAGAGQNVSKGTIIIWSAGGGRTSASNAAVALLDSKGWIIYMDGVIQ